MKVKCPICKGTGQIQAPEDKKPCQVCGTLTGREPPLCDKHWLEGRKRHYSRMEK